MSARLLDLLLRLAPRERRLLALLIFGVLPAAVLFGLLLPLADRRDAALAAEAEALALRDWTLARRAEIPASAGAEGAPPVGSVGVEQSLVAAGLRGAVSELGSRAGDVLELRFDAVPFVPLASWLTGEEPRWGYRIAGLRLEALERPGMVAAQMTLVPAASAAE